MKQLISLVSTLLLTLTLFCVKTTAQTQGMYDINVSLSLDVNNIKNTITIDRSVTIHKKVRFKIQTSLSHTTGYFKPETNATPIPFSNGAIFEYQYVSDGDKTLLFYQQTQENPNIPPVITGSVSAVLTVKKAQAGATYQSPDDIWTITTSQNFAPTCEAAAFPNVVPQKGYASVYIKYGAGHNGQLVRPVIFVDGIDFNTKTYTDPNKNNQVIRDGATGWDVLTLGMGEEPLDPDLENGQPDYEAFQVYPSAFRSLAEASIANGGESYDFMFIDFSNGSDYIQRNSLLLQELIRRINQEKVANAQGKRYKNVVIGASMGGLLARHALTSMEKRGEDHCTHTYVSFDAPQKGANIPLSIQAMGWFFGATSTDSEAQSFWQVLSTPAARQLLIDHFGKLTKNGTLAIEKFNWSDNFSPIIPEDFACLRNEFVEEMVQLDYPKNARNIAIACGSTLGNALANQGYDAGSELFDMHNHASDFGQVTQLQLYANGPSNLNFASSNTGYYVLSRCNPNAGFQHLGMTANPNNVLFAGAIPATFNQWLIILGGTPCSYNGMVVRNINPSGINMDHVQGCKRRDFPSIKRLLKAKAEESSLDFNLEEATYKRGFCFMPTMSTLDLNWGMNQGNLESAIDLDQVVRQRQTPFANVYAPNGQRDGGRNLKHVEISQSMVTWLQAEMLTGETLGNQNITIPTTAGVNQLDFERDGVIGSNYTINSGGILSVNATGAKPSVTVAVNGSCSAARVDVNTGGTFNIGIASAQGIVRVVTGGIVAINNGGTLKIENNSQIVIETGGKLIIEAGAILNLIGTESKIVIQKGGELVINGAIQINGNGFLQLDYGHIMTLNTHFVLRGSGKTTRMLRISAAPRSGSLVIERNSLSVGNGLFNMDISNGLIELEGNSTIEAGNIASVNVYDVTFTGTRRSIGLSLSNINTLAHVNNCVFEQLGVGISLLGSISFFLSHTIENCQFTDCSIGIEINSNNFSPNARPPVAALTVQGNTFNGYTGGGATACRFENTREINFTNNTIQGLRDGLNIESIIGVELNNVPNFRMNGGLIQDCLEGISGGNGENNNVFMFDGAEINSCETGIWLNGGRYTQFALTHHGLLLMDCAKLVNNQTGVKGRDVLLAIDAISNSGNFRPNTFSNPQGGLMFDICLKDFATHAIDARFNFWGQSLTPSSTINHLRFNIRNIGIHNSCDIDAPRILLNMSDPVNIKPNDVCLPGMGIPARCGILLYFNGDNLRTWGACHSSEPDSLDMLNEILSNIPSQFKLGLTALKLDSLSSAAELFQPISNIHNSMKDSANYRVQSLIDIARVISPYIPIIFRDPVLDPEYSVKRKQTATVQTFKVSPNPTNEQFDIMIPEGDYDIQVFDVLGKRVFTKNTEGVTTVDVRTWHNGIYIVNLLDKVSKKKTFSKVVVQH